MRRSIAFSRSPLKPAQALDSLDRSSSASRKRIRKPRNICGSHTILPTSYSISSHLLNVGSHSFPSGGFGKMHHGTLVDTTVCVKRLPASIWGISLEATKVRYRPHLFPYPIRCLRADPTDVLPRDRHGVIPAGDLSKDIEGNPGTDRIGPVGSHPVVLPAANPGN